MDNAAIESMIKDLIASYGRGGEVETTWREPIVGFAAADNPLFDQFKEVVRPTHAAPGELLPGAKSVIAYFIPFSKELHRQNFEAGWYCSRSWAVMYTETNRLISEINAHLRNELASQGYQTVLIPPTHNFDKQTLMSDWSHRHVAYAAGIGRFGVHNLLITARGCAGRVGSVVTDLPLRPSLLPRDEFCLHRAGMDCLKCVERCQYGALLADQYDRHACYRQCLANDQYHQDLDLTEVCGKCAAMVPCSVTNPVKQGSRG